MNNKVIEKIIENKLPVYFISPHLDDAVFSASNLILELKDKTKVTIVNVMTESNNFGSTFSALKFVKTCGYSNAENLFRDRRKEDSKIFKYLGVKKIDLGFVDATWRLKKIKNTYIKKVSSFLPELSHVYPTFRFHVHGRGISEYDHQIRRHIKDKLTNLIPENSVVFCPLSLGDHIDHVLVRNIVDSLGRRVVYWTDYPYLLENNVDFNPILQKPKNTFSIKSDNFEKEKLIKMYKTQFNAMFPDGKVQLGLETFYYSDEFKKINKPTVTIGIPSYNESKNILYLINDLLKQNTKSFVLNKIIVFNDASTDSTSDLVKNFAKNSKKISVIDLKTNKGIANATNKIFESTNDDVCVILNADIRIQDELAISKLIFPILRNFYDLSSLKITPIKSSSIFSKLLLFSNKLKNRLFEKIDENSVYSCHGPARAFSKRLYKKIYILNNYGDDMYSYIYTITNGFRYKYVDTGEVLYKMPTKFSEHLSQSIRFNVSIKQMKNLFNDEIVNKIFELPNYVLLITFIDAFFSNPIYFICYIALNIYTKFLLNFNISKYENLNWKSINSTKDLS